MAFTFFFRDMHTLKLIEDHVIPHLKGRKYLDTWDAGCAHGPEAYSLAIMLRENMGEFLFRNVRIHATDINPEFGNVIGRGVYPDKEVKRIPSDLLQKYFMTADEPGHFAVAEALRKAVSFQHHDLTSLQAIRDGFGLIVCKNVLLHFKEQARLDVIRMFRDALAPGGFLVMEQTQTMPDQVARLFERVTNDGQVFQRRD